MKLTTVEKVVGIAAILIIGHAILVKRKQSAIVIGNIPAAGTTNAVLSESAREKRKIELVGIITNMNAQINGLIPYNGDKNLLKQKMNEYLQELNAL